MDGAGPWPPCSQGPLSSSLKRGRRREDPGNEVVTLGEDHKPGTMFSIGDAGSLWERNIVLEKANTRENKERKRLIDAILTRVHSSFANRNKTALEKTFPLEHSKED